MILCCNNILINSSYIVVWELDISRPEVTFGGQMLQKLKLSRFALIDFQSNKFSEPRNIEIISISSYETMNMKF